MHVQKTLSMASARLSFYAPLAHATGKLQPDAIIAWSTVHRASQSESVDPAHWLERRAGYIKSTNGLFN